MCGRLFQTLPPEKVREWFATRNPVPNYPPRFNAAPTDQIAVVRRNPQSGERSLDLLRWGLLTRSAAKDPRKAKPLINIRAESVKGLESFDRAIAERRCLVPADGFYEWRREGKVLQPFAIGPAPASTPGLALAGFWNNWQSPEGDWLRSFTILTTDANELIADIHDRMPVIIDAADYGLWLGDEDQEFADLAKLLRPYPAEKLRRWPVSPRVNNVRNQEPGLHEPVPAMNSL